MLRRRSKLAASPKDEAPPLTAGHDQWGQVGGRAFRCAVRSKDGSDNELSHP